jgi:hypothetical protein
MTMLYNRLMEARLQRTPEPLTTNNSNEYEKALRLKMMTQQVLESLTVQPPLQQLAKSIQQEIKSEERVEDVPRSKSRDRNENIGYESFDGIAKVVQSNKP